MIFQYGVEPVLIQRILIGFEAILETGLPNIRRIQLLMNYILYGRQLLAAAGQQERMRRVTWVV